MNKSSQIVEKKKKANGTIPLRKNSKLPIINHQLAFPPSKILKKKRRSIDI
jgi:hypothetical protein